MPAPRRSGDDVPCSPERGGCAALRRRIPADCVLAGTGRVCCRTGRTSRRRLSYVHIRKERASFARAHPHKGFGARDEGRNGCGMPEVANLKHASRGTRRPCSDRALRDKAEQWGMEFFPTGAVAIGRFPAEIRPVADAKRFMRFTCRRRHRGRRSRAGPDGDCGAGRSGCRSHGHIAKPTRGTRCACPSRSCCTGSGPIAEPVHALDAPLSRRAPAPRRRAACRRARRCCRDRSARARSSSGRASRARCRVRRQPC